MPVLPTLREVQTSSTGTERVHLADEQCRRVTIINQSGTTLRLYLAGSVYITLATATDRTLPVRSNSKEILLKRDDESNSQVTVKYLTEREAT